MKYYKLAWLVNFNPEKIYVAKWNVPFGRCLLQPYRRGTSHHKSQNQRHFLK